MTKWFMANQALWLLFSFSLTNNTATITPFLGLKLLHSCFANSAADNTPEFSKVGKSVFSEYTLYLLSSHC